MRHSSCRARAAHWVTLLTWISLPFTTVPAAADYEDGVNAAFAGDFDTAFREFSLAAQQGLDLAQYNLAILYFTGQGVDQDYEQAFRWTEAAAVQGHINAQANLASLYLEGTGVTRNVAQAINWFSAAARSGHASAAMTLTAMYRDGEPIGQDIVQALSLIHISEPTRRS